MSRRTRLLIAALFLVLLGIPVVYLTITWAPANPLRVRLVGHKPPDSTNPVGSHLFEFEIENTCASPIHLYEAHLEVAAPAGVSGLLLDMSDMAAPTSSVHGTGTPGPTPIPPCSTRRCQSRIPHYIATAVPIGKTTARLAWASHTKHATALRLRDLREQLPAILQPYLPMPSVHGDIFPVEQALPRSAILLIR